MGLSGGEAGVMTHHQHTYEERAIPQSPTCPNLDRADADDSSA